MRSNTDQNTIDANELNAEILGPSDGVIDDNFVAEAWHPRWHVRDRLRALTLTCTHPPHAESTYCVRAFANVHLRKSFGTLVVGVHRPCTTANVGVHVHVASVISVGTRHALTSRRAVFESCLSKYPLVFAERSYCA